jgi:hypothetical protein
MLFESLIHKIIVIDFRSNCRIDEFFFQLAMHLKLGQCRLDNPLLSLGIFGLLKFFKRPFTFL